MSQFNGLLNLRQEKVLNKMFDAGPNGFEAGMRAKKYMSIAKTSKATATRDLIELAKLNALFPHGEKRGRFYVLNI